MKTACEEAEAELAALKVERDELRAAAASLSADVSALGGELEALKAAQPQGAISDEEMARKFHETYERLAPQFNYETRHDTRSFDPTTPNGRLMIAVCRALLSEAGTQPERVSVPREPTDELLTSMAIRFDHGLGVPGYYDNEMMLTMFPGGHAARMESTKRIMRQLHEEVVGTGFYRAAAQEGK